MYREGVLKKRVSTHRLMETREGGGGRRRGWWCVERGWGGYVEVVGMGLEVK